MSSLVIKINNETRDDLVERIENLSIMESCSNTLDRLIFSISNSDTKNTVHQAH